MTTLIQTARPVLRPAQRPVRGVVVRLLVRLCEADAAYRQRAQLRQTSDEHLADMGLSRADVERAFGR